jgi:hypothetical protein
MQQVEIGIIVDFGWQAERAGEGNEKCKK